MKLKTLLAFLFFTIFISIPAFSGAQDYEDEYDSDDMSSSTSSDESTKLNKPDEVDKFMGNLFDGLANTLGVKEDAKSQNQQSGEIEKTEETQKSEENQQQESSADKQKQETNNPIGNLITGIFGGGNQAQSTNEEPSSKSEDQSQKTEPNETEKPGESQQQNSDNPIGNLLTGLFGGGTNNESSNQASEAESSGANTSTLGSLLAMYTGVGRQTAASKQEQWVKLIKQLDFATKIANQANAVRMDLRKAIENMSVAVWFANSIISIQESALNNSEETKTKITEIQNDLSNRRELSKAPSDNFKSEEASVNMISEANSMSPRIEELEKLEPEKLKSMTQENLEVFLSAQNYLEVVFRSTQMSSENMKTAVKDFNEMSGPVMVESAKLAGVVGLESNDLAQDIGNLGSASIIEKIGRAYEIKNKIQTTYSDFNSLGSVLKNYISEYNSFKSKDEELAKVALEIPENIRRAQALQEKVIKMRADLGLASASLKTGVDMGDMQANTDLPDMNDYFGAITSNMDDHFGAITSNIDNWVPEKVELKTDTKKFLADIKKEEEAKKLEEAEKLKEATVASENTD